MIADVVIRAFPPCTIPIDNISFDPYIQSVNYTLLPSNEEKTVYTKSGLGFYFAQSNGNAEKTDSLARIRNKLDSPRKEL